MLYIFSVCIKPFIAEPQANKYSGCTYSCYINAKDAFIIVWIIKYSLWV